MRPAAPGSKRSSGFTLMELMVVIVMIGIVTAMILPEMRGTYEDALLRSTARKLVDACNIAYSRSVTVSRLHRLRIDQKGGHYFIEAKNAEGSQAYAPIRDDAGSTGDLDSRITIDLRNMNDPADDKSESAPSERREDDPDNSSTGLIMFHPDGTADPIEITLRDRQGFRLGLRINPTTARVHIVELEHE